MSRKDFRKQPSDPCLHIILADEREFEHTGVRILTFENP